MGAFLGLLGGLGLASIWSAFMVPRVRREQVARRRLQELLVRAGLSSVSPAGFLVMCVVLAAATFVVLQLEFKLTLQLVSSLLSISGSKPEKRS